MPMRLIRHAPISILTTVETHRVYGAPHWGTIPRNQYTRLGVKVNAWFLHDKPEPFAFIAIQAADYTKVKRTGVGREIGRQEFPFSRRCR